MSGGVPEDDGQGQDGAVDLVVAGAGGGLAGALRAAQAGLNVLVVDADEQFLRGNNTSMSTAMIPGAGSRWQRAAAIEDSPRVSSPTSPPRPTAPRTPHSPQPSRGSAPHWWSGWPTKRDCR
ncbi:hypothetical protein MBT84_44890 [Streptomyces sp. MBT84]|uniref:FAD-binding protein n=1 Tax=Streptomyces sp. MBT84 TaxID=1488414 RepID=UPI001DF50E8D|nr:hypothetical protein [Streptomyces sp. MBT84]